jgi:hypothetical protein
MSRVLGIGHSGCTACEGGPTCPPATVAACSAAAQPSVRPRGHRGDAQHGMARHGTARRCTARRCTALHSPHLGSRTTTRPGGGSMGTCAQQGTAQHSTAQHSTCHLGQPQVNPLDGYTRIMDTNLAAFKYFLKVWTRGVNVVCERGVWTGWTGRPPPPPPPTPYSAIPRRPVRPAVQPAVCQPPRRWFPLCTTRGLAVRRRRISTRSPSTQHPSPWTARG